MKKACEHYANRNGCAPSVEELESIFDDLADKFAPEPSDDASDSSSESSDSEDDSGEEADDLSSLNANNMTKSLLSDFNDALDHVHELAKKDKAQLQKKIEQKWKAENDSEITAEESEAVFAVIGKMFQDGPSSVTQGDADEADADYELTDADKQIQKEDEQVEESEGEDEQDEFVCLDGELEFTSPTVKFSDIVEEVLEELGLELQEDEEQTIEYSSNIEISEKLFQDLKSKCPGATEEDATDVLTSKFTDAEFDDEDDEEYQPEAEKDEDEESVYEEVEEEEEASPKFLDVKFGEDDGEEYGFDDFAADHQDEQDSDEFSDDSEQDSDAEAEQEKEQT